MLCQERRIFTATNGKEIYYQDWADIRRHSDGEIIREEMKAICMAAIEKGLLYVPEEGEQWLYKQKTEKTAYKNQ